nr:STAS domain-containing protein [Cylindrospermopsis raciborskii]
MVEKEATMSQLQIEIKSHRLGDFSGHGLVVIVVTPAGPLNRDTNWQLRLKLQECISKLSKHIVVNLREVNFIDESGLTALVAGMRDADKEGGSFRLCEMPPKIKSVFEELLMDTIFKIFETEEEALEVLR